MTRQRRAVTVLALLAATSGCATVYSVRVESPKEGGGWSTSAYGMVTRVSADSVRLELPILEDFEDASTTWCVVPRREVADSFVVAEQFALTAFRSGLIQRTPRGRSVISFVLVPEDLDRLDQQGYAVLTDTLPTAPERCPAFLPGASERRIVVEEARQGASLMVGALGIALLLAGATGIR